MSDPNNNLAIVEKREDYERRRDKLVANQPSSSEDWEKELHKQYIQEILPLVIPLSQSKEAGQHKTADLLVLTLGMSFEPLLIATAYWQPRRILLVRNRRYSVDGQTVGVRFRDRVKLLAQQFGWPHDDKLFLQDCVLQSDDPARVFADLRDASKGVPKAIESVKQDFEISKPRVVFDITGGKKSMVSGAFLFAAYMPGIQIAYVDFEEYDVIRNRPKDESCRVSVLDNPYDVFRLRDWEQVQRAYEMYRFDDGIQKLKRIMDAEKKYLSQHNVQFEMLCKVIETYHAWNSGNLRQAKDLLNRLPAEIKLRMPTAIEALHDAWPEEKDLTTKDSSGLRNKVDKAALYAKDELAKIERIIKFSDDYRSGLIRAYGVHELLLEVRKGGKLEGEEKDQQSDVLGLAQGLHHLMTGKDFRTVRNNLTHVHHSVPRPFAEDALAITRANFKDFRENWLVRVGRIEVNDQLEQMVCEAIPWNDLLDKVGLDELKLIDYTSDDRSAR